MPVRARLNVQAASEYDDCIVQYLTTGEGASEWSVFDLEGQPHGLADAWRALGPRITARWIRHHPGTRPWGWWQFGAPRWQRADLPARVRGLGDVILATLPEPRRRRGGIGTPSYEVLNDVPHFAYGLPVTWVSRFDEAYYNGRRLDVHGNRIGTEYPEGHFAGLAPRADDPPVFESQASYLDRHHLMSVAEMKRLPADASAPETIVIPPERR